MTKCDVRGCDRKAAYFTPSFSMCFIHWEELVREAERQAKKYSCRRDGNIVKT